METKVPIGVSRYVPSEVRSETYRLVDMICSTVEALFETDTKLWPNSSSCCPDLLEKMLNTVMDQGWYSGTGGVDNGLTKPLMRDLMQEVVKMTEHNRTQLEINGGPFEEVMTNLLQMTKVDKTQALLLMDERDRKLITTIADATTTGMLQRHSEHGAWIIKGKYTGCQFAHGKSLSTGVTNGRLERELENGRKAMPEMSAGQYETLFDPEKDGPDSEEEELLDPFGWRSRLGVGKKEVKPERKESEQTQTTSEPPTYEQAKRQAISNTDQKKKRQMDKIVQKEEVKMQRDKEVEEEEADLFVCSYTRQPYVSIAQTMADLEANMYEYRKRVIFSQAILKEMSMERTFWQNDEWEAGPRNGRVNGVSFNGSNSQDATETTSGEHVRGWLRRRRLSN